MTNQQPDYAVKLFYSYSHKDKEYLEALKTALAPLRDTGLLEDWSDQNILPGKNIDTSIPPRIDGADVLVFLVSPDFLSSSACMEEWEHAKGLESRHPNLVRRVPIIVRDCEWKGLVRQDDDTRGALGIKALPEDGAPVARFDQSCVAWRQVRKGIKEVVHEVRENMLSSIVKDFSNVTKRDHVVFVYGSLLDPRSLARTIGRVSPAMEYIPVHLVNHVTEWGAPSRRLNYSSDEWKSLDDVEWLWLALRHTGNESDVVPGALIKLSDSQFQRVRERESHYNEAVVTHDVRIDERAVKNPRGSLYGKIVTFAPKLSSASEIKTGVPTAVRSGYYDGIEVHLRRLHPGGTADLPEIRAGVERLPGFQADDRVAEVFWRQNSARRLHDFWSSLDEELGNRGVIRRTSEGRKETIPFVLRPVILNRRTYREVVHAAEAAVSLMVKAHRLVLKSRKLSDISRYTDVDRSLVDSRLANNGDEPPALARVDLTILGDRLRVFEVNADSPAGMFHLDELARLQREKIGLKELTGGLGEMLQPADVQVCDSVVEAFYRHWERYRERAAASGLSKELRRIAIVDRHVHEAAAYSEFQRFEKILARDGVDARIVDMENLRYRAEHKELTDEEGRPIDAVYKRILWQDAIDLDMGGRDDPLCQAYLDDAVYVMNSFRSRLVGSKLNMAIAWSPSFKADCARNDIELTREELDALEKYIPETILWEAKELDDRPAKGLYDCVMGNISDWVLKGFHGKGGKEFIDGRSDPLEFQRAWSSQDRSHIAQRREEHGLLDVPVVDEQRHREITWRRYPYTLGAYVIDGKCVAIEAKVAEEAPINVNQGALRTPVFSLKE